MWGCGCRAGGRGGSVRRGGETIGQWLICTGGLELEGVEVRVQIDDKDKTKVEDLIPKQVGERGICKYTIQFSPSLPLTPLHPHPFPLPHSHWTCMRSSLSA